MSTANRDDGTQCAVNAVSVHGGGSSTGMESLTGEHPAIRSGTIRLLRLPQVIEVTGLGKTKIYELQAQGTFPRRVKITAHSVGWVEAEIQAWLAKRVELSARPPAGHACQV